MQQSPVSVSVSSRKSRHSRVSVQQQRRQSSACRRARCSLRSSPLFCRLHRLHLPTLMELLHLPTPQYLLRVALLQQRDRSPHLQSARSAQNTQNTQPSKMCRTPLRHSTTRTCSRIRYFAPLLLFYSSPLLLLCPPTPHTFYRTPCYHANVFGRFILIFALVSY